MTRVPPRKARKTTFDVATLAELFTRFRQLKTAEAEAKKGHEKLRDEELMPALIKHGVAHGEKGQHLAIDLPEPIDGFVRLVRRTNQSSYVNVDAAEKLFESKGLLDEIQVVDVTFPTVPATSLPDLERALVKGGLEKLGIMPVLTKRFDQEAMYAAYQRQRQELKARLAKGERVPAAEMKREYITEAELDALIETDETYSFHPDKTT